VKAKKALLVVDIQKDFCPGGALSVAEGDEIIPNLNRYIEIFLDKKLPVFITRDLHPKDTKHFKRFGGVWPEHCVEGTEGAEFHPDLKVAPGPVVISKGMDPEEDSYSAFQAADSKGTGFSELLKGYGVGEIFVGGIATDFCVKYTALDALEAGLKVTILTDAIKGVNLKPPDSAEAIKEMAGKGAMKITLKEISL